MNLACTHTPEKLFRLYFMVIYYQKRLKHILSEKLILGVIKLNTILGPVDNPLLIDLDS